MTLPHRAHCEERKVLRIQQRFRRAYTHAALVNRLLRNDHLSGRTIPARFAVFAFRQRCTLILSYRYHVTLVAIRRGCQGYESGR